MEQWQKKPEERPEIKEKRGIPSGFVIFMVVGLVAYVGAMFFLGDTNPFFKTRINSRSISRVETPEPMAVSTVSSEMPNLTVSLNDKWDTINISVPATVILSNVEADNQRVFMSANNQDVFDKIKVELKNGELLIGLVNSLWPFEGNTIFTSDLVIYVSSASITEINAGGATNIVCDSALSGKDLKLGVSGASSCNLELSYNAITANISGASNAYLSGGASSLTAIVSGASKLDSSDMAVSYGTGNVSGASKFVVFADEELYLDVSGASKVQYLGNPRITQDVSGASKVEPLRG